MKLGEAKKELENITIRLLESKALLLLEPRSGIVATLNECSELLRRQQHLQKQIDETEAITHIEGTSLADLHTSLSALKIKVGLLSTLTARTDLDDKTKEIIFSQLKNYKNSLDSLEVSVTNCLWETQLVE